MSFKSLLDSYGYILLIKEYTRMFKGSNSCFDNVITNHQDVANCRVVNTGFSDHHAQIVSFSETLKTNNAQIISRIFSEKQIILFQNLLNNVEQWLGMYNCKNVNGQIDLFLKIFLQHFNTCFPLKLMKSVSNKVDKL